ncbi:MAG: hypothetical protein EOO77_10100 [Oxalobacteraceae bacterium]|nr:MAG: hypothetical protein EOO77_10100 [Oxalobacteraceae bacterium]
MVAPMLFFSARRYLCATAKAVAWPGAEPTDACGELNSGFPNPLRGRVFIPALQSAHRQLHRFTARCTKLTLTYFLLPLNKSIGDQPVDNAKYAPSSSSWTNAECTLVSGWAQTVSNVAVANACAVLA